MAVFNKKCLQVLQRKYNAIHNTTCLATIVHSENSQKQQEENCDDFEFRKFEIMKPKAQSTFRERPKLKSLPPRYKKLEPTQKWKDVWPAAHSFKASVVPLPLRQGYVEKGVAPSKYGNAELMKIPNFLHLTPPAIKEHCRAIKKFCTSWPKGLETDENCQRHFPVEVITSDFCHSSPSLRDPRSRIVTLKVPLSSLQLDAHAKDKLLRLVGERYNSETGILRLVAERCPVRKQNYDYAHYLLTALFHESWTIEDWESQRTEVDMEKYIWNGSKSEAAIKNLAQKLTDLQKKDESKENLPQWIDNLSQDSLVIDVCQDVQEYADAVTRMHNEGEDEYITMKYKESVLKLLGFSKDDANIKAC